MELQDFIKYLTSFTTFLAAKAHGMFIFFPQID